MSAAESEEPKDEAGQIIREHGDAVIDYMVQLIRAAVYEGDDARVDRLDRLMRDIEDRLAAARRRR